MNSGVECILCNGEPFDPVISSLTAERSQVRLYFLIEPLRLSVGLGMIRSGQGALDA